MNIKEIIELFQGKYGVKNFRQIKNNYWRCEILTKEERSQLIHIYYKEIRRDKTDESRIIIETPIGPLHKDLNYENILRKNSQLEVGTFCIEDLRNEGNMVIPYLTLRATHLVHTADKEEVFELAEKVANKADELEKEIFARDLH